MSTERIDAAARRPVLATGRDQAAARAVVAELVAGLQAGWDSRDATISDRRLAADVAWGSPYGETVDNADDLLAIHQRLEQASVGGRRSRYDVDRVAAVSDDVIIARVARHALGADGRQVEPDALPDGAFSEMVLYVLVRHDDRWWVAAGHNTPIREKGSPGVAPR